MLTTSRRFASSRWSLAARPSATIVAQVGAQLGRDRRRSVGELLLGEEAGLDPLGEVDLLRGGEQLGAADAVEVRPDQVGARPRARRWRRGRRGCVTASCAVAVACTRCSLILRTICASPRQTSGATPAARGVGVRTSVARRA